MKHRANDQKLTITRYPATSNRSLQAWSAADELVLNVLANQELSRRTVVVYDDRFGFLTAYLHTIEPLTVVTYKSQQKALELNLGQNALPRVSERWLSPLVALPETIDLGIVRVPKSLDLFKLYLAQLTASLAPDGQAICAFMTRYFSAQMIAIAEEFFEHVEQSLAWKKARLLTLTRKKPVGQLELLNALPLTFQDGSVEVFKQYYGVFSAGNIDYATQFLLEHLALAPGERRVLDLASGNGVIARAIQRQRPGVELHLVDDSRLAVESSKLNLTAENVHFHWDDGLEQFERESFDLVVSNPPFHFGHETNIEVSQKLFRQVGDVLKAGGRFVCVANKHLNYMTHLTRTFRTVKTVAENEKYVIYTCVR
ncbi:MAG: methyltransferase [Bradymonadaceae bacterium]|nr:methyltransferase [Lujinxingiaceae bacterium]